jgi:hypothetical protein
MPRYKFEKKDFCLRGHPRTPENLSKNRYCKICHAQHQRDNKKKYLRKKNVARCYKLGWSPKLYLQTKKKQKNRCAICRRRFRHTVDSNSNACRDHKHGRTPIPRGLLCHCCNLLIGNAKESVSILKSAVRYLNKWN